MFCPPAALPASVLALEPLQYILHFLNITQRSPGNVTALLCHLLPPRPLPSSVSPLCGLLDLAPAITRALCPCLSRHLCPSPVRSTTQSRVENRSAAFCYAHLLFPVTISKNEEIKLIRKKTKSSPNLRMNKTEHCLLRYGRVETSL